MAGAHLVSRLTTASRRKTRGLDTSLSPRPISPPCGECVGVALRETSKPETKTGATEVMFHADMGSLFRFRCVSCNGRLPHRRYADGFTKLLSVAGDNSDLAPTPAGSHVEQFFLHGVCGDDHGVYGFALASMGGDGITVCELVIVRRKCSSVFEAYGT